MDLTALAKTIDNTLRYLTPADLGESLHHDTSADQWLISRRGMINNLRVRVIAIVKGDSSVTIEVATYPRGKRYVTTLLPGDFTQTLLQRHVEYGMKQVIPNFTSAFAQN